MEISEQRPKFILLISIYFVQNKLFALFLNSSLLSILVLALLPTSIFIFSLCRLLYSRLKPTTSNSLLFVFFFSFFSPFGATLSSGTSSADPGADECLIGGDSSSSIAKLWSMLKWSGSWFDGPPGVSFSSLSSSSSREPSSSSYPSLPLSSLSSSSSLLLLSLVRSSWSSSSSTSSSLEPSIHL